MLRAKEGLQKQVTACSTAFDSATAAVTTPSGQVLTMSEYISCFDEGARRRLEVISQKLKDLEMQMEVLETEVSKASDFPSWA